MSLSTVAGLHFISALCLDPPPFTHTGTHTLSLFFFSPRLPISSFPPSLFIYFHQPYLCCCFSRLCTEQRHSFAHRSSSFELGVAGQSRPSGGGSGIIFDDLFIVLLQFAGGSQYNIHLSMHNTGWDQSWVKDNSKDCRLGLDCGAGAQTAASGAETSSLSSALPRSLHGDSSVLSFPRLSTSFKKKKAMELLSVCRKMIFHCSAYIFVNSK